MMKKSVKTLSLCSILWDDLSPARLQDYFAQIKRSNLLQSPEYGRAVARLNHQRRHCGLIMIDGREAGLVQVLEAGILRGAVQGVILDRGPLWFDGFGSNEDIAAFFTAFASRYPKRFGRRVRIIPECAPAPWVDEMLAAQKFRKNGAPYMTAWLDLRHEEEALRANMSKSWRGALRHAERADFEVRISDQGAYFGWILENYAQDKLHKGYDGASVKLINALAREFLVGKNMLIATCLLEGEPIAAIVVFVHGSSATYQIGYTSEMGREMSAHHMLLWKMCAALRERAVYDFDLGGVNEMQSRGVYAFKKAMGADLVTTCGVYC